MLIMRKTKIKYPWTSLTTSWYSKIRICAMVFSIFHFLKRLHVTTLRFSNACAKYSDVLVEIKKQKLLSISTLLVGGSYTNYTIVIANLLTVTKHLWIVSLLLDLFFLLSPTIPLPEDYMSMSFSLYEYVFFTFLCGVSFWVWWHMF